MNVFINSILTLTMIYSTAVILKRSESFLDIAMNSVAVFFISELDDMMISDLDEYALSKRAVQSLLYYMRELSMKDDIDNLSEHLVAESMLTRLFAFGAYAILLPYSIYIFFSGSAAQDC
mmetsp:Transcript_18931/g.33020  ORF Transcript_18931/g.33020 Transcript_18931/m.33020 type:complete len:120 (+) Transcript_18931:1118-1477(+)